MGNQVMLLTLREGDIIIHEQRRAVLEYFCDDGFDYYGKFHYLDDANEKLILRDDSYNDKSDKEMVTLFYRNYFDETCIKEFSVNDIDGIIIKLHHSSDITSLNNNHVSINIKNKEEYNNVCNTLDNLAIQMGWID